MEEIRKIIRETIFEVFGSDEINNNEKTKLSVFDFDSTLMDTPLPETGKFEWEESTGEKWDGDWWRSPNSLDMNVFNILPNYGVISDYNKEWDNPNTLVIMLTGRIGRLSSEVENILSTHGLSFDKYLYKQGSKETSEDKIGQLNKILEDNPQIKEVEMWDDRTEHIPIFDNWGNELVNSGRLESFTINHVTESQNIEENVGPGPYDVTPVSDIMADIANQKFTQKDFRRKYDPDNEEFWFEDEYEKKNPKTYSQKEDPLSDEMDLSKDEVEFLDKKYRKLKKKSNWK